MTNDAISDAKAAAVRGDFESAIAVLRPLADAGNRDAQYELGFLALTECEVISGREAFSLFKKAADDGHAEAMYHLATFPELASRSSRRCRTRKLGNGCCVPPKAVVLRRSATLARRSRPATGVTERSLKISQRPSDGIDVRRKPDILMPSTTSRPCLQKARAALEICRRPESG